MADEQQHESADKPASGSKFEPITSQDELNRVIGERISRERAKYADYEDLRTKAQRLAELERAQMTETERTEARIRAAEERATHLEASNVRKDVALSYGLSAEDAALLEGLTDQDAMKRLAERLARQAQDDAKPRTPKPSPAQRAGDDAAEDKDAVARAVFGI